MLRSVLIAASAAAIVAGAVLSLAGAREQGLALLSSGVVVFLATAFERWRYRTARRLDGEKWERTGERFEDPASGAIVEVFYNARTGERRYIPRDESRDPDRAS